MVLSSNMKNGSLMVIVLIIGFIDTLIPIFVDLFGVITVAIGIAEIKGLNLEELKIGLFLLFIVAYLYGFLFLRNKEDD